MTNTARPSYVWKNKTWGDTCVPADALRPSCEVYLQLSPNSPAVRDSDVTDMHDWHLVVKYQALPPYDDRPRLFPENDELRGTANDYESAQEQLQDTHAYNKVDWVFIVFIVVFFCALFGLT